MTEAERLKHNAIDINGLNSCDRERIGPNAPMS